MDAPAAIGFALGFVLGCLFKFTVTTGGGVIILGFRAFNAMNLTLSTDTLVISFIASTLICLVLAIILAKIGHELGEVI